MSTVYGGEVDLPCPVDGCDGTVRVSVDVYPGEEPVRYPNRKAHPGSPAEASIGEIVERYDCAGHGDLTSAQIDRMEEANQGRMLRGAGERDEAMRERHAERRREDRLTRREYDI